MRILTIAAALLAFPAGAQTPDASPAAALPEAPAALRETPWRTLDPADTLLIESTKGRIIIEMRPDLAPLTVARIKALTRQGYYDGALFYRAIEGFMAQTGDKGSRQYRSNLPNLKGEMTFALPASAPYESIGSAPGADVGYVGTLPVMIETTALAGDGMAGARGHIVFCPGVAAMAHPADQPDGGNSQFFLMRSYAPALERDYAAWGRIVVGQEAVEAIRNGEPPANPDKMNRVRVLADLPAAQRPTVEVSDLRGSYLTDLVQTVVAEKGAGFTLCDVPVQARVVGG